MGWGPESVPFPVRHESIQLIHRFGASTTSARKIAQEKARECLPLGVPIWRYAVKMKDILSKLWHEEDGQDIAEYAVMLAVILVIVVGTIRLIGSNANNVFSSVASSIQ